MEKILKHIDGFINEYRITEDGEIYAVNGKKITYRFDKEGRPYTFLKCDNGKRKFTYISRAVATAFCEIPDHLKNFDLAKLEVHHIDGNPANNHYTNLLWVSKEEHEKIHGCGGKCVAQIKNNTIVGLYSSLKQAAKTTGIPIQNISDCINGAIRKKNKRRLSAGGYKWTNKLEGEYILSLQ